MRSFLPMKKCALSKSRATHNDLIPVGCHSSSCIFPAAYKMELFNPKVGLRVHFSRERLCVESRDVTEHGCLCGQYH